MQGVRTRDCTIIYIGPSHGGRTSRGPKARPAVTARPGLRAVNHVSKRVVQWSDHWASTLTGFAPCGKVGGPLSLTRV